METLLEAGVKMGGEVVSDSDIAAPSWVVEGRWELDGVHLSIGSRDGVVEYPIDGVLDRSLIDSTGEWTVEGCFLVVSVLGKSLWSYRSSIN